MNVALASLLSPQPSWWGLSLLGALCAISRAELAGLLVALLPIVWLKLGTRKVLLAAFTSLLALSIAVVLDTYLWDRSFVSIRAQKGLLWAELEAVLFNVIEGKSSEWGVSG